MIPINELDISVRAYNLIIPFLNKKKEEPTLENLCKFTLKEFKEQRNVGVKSVDEILKIMNEHGLFFSDIKKSDIDLTRVKKQIKLDDLDQKIKDATWELKSIKKELLHIINVVKHLDLK